MKFTTRAFNRLSELLQYYDEPELYPCVGILEKDKERHFTLDFIMPQDMSLYALCELQITPNTIISVHAQEANQPLVASAAGMKILCLKSDQDLFLNVVFDYLSGGLDAGWRSFVGNKT